MSKILTYIYDKITNKLIYFCKYKIKTDKQIPQRLIYWLTVTLTNQSTLIMRLIAIELKTFNGCFLIKTKE